MKTLLVPALAMVLILSCQPSDKGATTKETLTQKKTSTDEGKAVTITTAVAPQAAATQERFVTKSKVLANFIKGFPHASLPLALNSKSSKRINNEAYINSDYVRFIPEMEEETFSREVGKEYYYMARVSETKDRVTVIYAVKNVMMGDNAPYGYVVASYNSKGKRVDKLLAGGQIELTEALRVGKIEADGSIEVKEFNQKWAKDPKEEGYYDNKVVGTSLKRTKHYQIKADGFIQRLEEQAVAMR